MKTYDVARQNMVNSQLLTNGVLTPAVVEAFGAVPREIFVEAGLRDIAYCDEALDLGQGRAMLSPMVLGKMIEALGAFPEDSALCVGGDAGYAAAVLSWVCGWVTDLESDDRFTARNQAARAQWAQDDVTRVVGDLRGGAKSADGYDVILVCGAVSEAPYDLALSLKPNGRMVAIVQPSVDAVGTVYVFQKAESGHVSARPLFEASGSYLPGFAPASRFSFAS